MDLTTRATAASDPRPEISDSTRPDRPYISCVAPAYNEAANIEPLVAALDQRLRQIGLPYEVIVVDDGSQDGTAEAAIRAATSYPVRLVQLSRNFGRENAIMAGLDHATGDVVILIDADLQHPPSLITAMLERWREGYDMVYAVHTHRDDTSLSRRWGTRIFYKMLSGLSQTKVTFDASDYRLMDRKVVDALRSLPERSRFIKGLFPWVGFKTIGVPFSVDERTAGRSSFNPRRLAALALTGITSFSELPLRIWGLIGAVVSAISLLYAVWIVFETLVIGDTVPGWATLAAALMFFGGVQLLSIGILGEYIGRIYNEVKQRPLYLVARKHGFGSRGDASDAPRS